MRIDKKDAKVGDWRIDIVESERGWGSKVDDSIYFTDRDEAIAWAADYNKKYNPAGPVPDWYMVAEQPVQVR